MNFANVAKSQKVGNPYDPAMEYVAYAADVFILRDVEMQKAVVVEVPTRSP